MRMALRSSPAVSRSIVGRLTSQVSVSAVTANDIWGHHTDFRLAWCTRPGLRRRGGGVASSQGLIGGFMSRVDIVVCPAAVMSMREGPFGCRKVPVLTGPASALAGSYLDAISACAWRQGGTGNREPGTGNRGSVAGSREPGTRNRELEAGNQKLGAGNREQEPGTRNKGVRNFFVRSAPEADPGRRRKRFLTPFSSIGGDSYAGVGRVVNQRKRWL